MNQSVNDYVHVTLLFLVMDILVYLTIFNNINL